MQELQNTNRIQGQNWEGKKHIKQINYFNVLNNLKCTSFQKLLKLYSNWTKKTDT